MVEKPQAPLKDLVFARQLLRSLWAGKSTLGSPSTLMSCPRHPRFFDGREELLLVCGKSRWRNGPAAACSGIYRVGTGKGTEWRFLAF